jgi:hypothetical protein
LCLQEEELQRSHLVGRAVTKLITRMSRGPAVVMTPEVVLRTSRQVTAHLLCKHCEDLFSKNGEQYVTGLLWRGKRFPALDILRSATPLKRESTHLSFSGLAAGFKMEKLAYYALSVVWRCAVHKWPTIGLQTANVKVENRLDDIRQYLLGDAPYPEDIVVVISVCTDLVSQLQCLYPSVYLSPDGYPSYPFLVLGLHFNVIVADSRTDFSQLCSVASAERWIFAASHEEFSTKQFGELHKEAKVARNVQAIWSNQP